MDGNSQGLELEDLLRVLAKELWPDLVFERNLRKFLENAVVTEACREIAGVHDLV